jgi:ABC-type Mn2+/Zn2+ transport system ATPase subunit
VSDSHNIIRFKEVGVRYGNHTALRDLSLDIPCGSITAILGPNGAGKSTFLRACLGWLPLSHGEIRIGDSHLEHALPRLAYLPQRQSIDWDFPITVQGVVDQGRYPRLKPWQRFKQADHDAVKHALEELGITALAKRQISQLSAGQQQRVFLARALAQGADIFLLDEPFNGLDVTATEELAHLLRSWEAQGRTVLAAVHDFSLAKSAFSRGILLSNKLIATGPILSVLSEANIEAAFKGTHSTDKDPLKTTRSASFPS